MSFNWEVYNLLNPDLGAAGLTTPSQLESHWLKWGKYESRICNITQLYPEFIPKVYKSIYPDLADMNNNQLELHWLEWGRKEGRVYNIKQLYPGFNYDNYANNYPDLEHMTDSELEIHWIQWGKDEGRTYERITDKPINGKRIRNKLTNDTVITIPSKINIKFVKIVRNPTNGYYLFCTLLEYFEKLNIGAVIVDSITKNDNTIYLIPFGHLYEIPESTKYILYQLEQKKQSNWLDESYNNKIRKSIATFDYSYANFNAFPEDVQKKLIYIPFPMTFIREKKNNNKYDIIFYGGLNPRRNRILNRLKEVFPNRVFIVNGVCGSELNEYIKRCKIVLNIHYYDNALLETTRLNESLKFNKRIISEKGNNDDIHNNNLYNGIIDFVDIINDDLSNIGQLINKISYFLSGNNYILNKNIELENLANTCYSCFRHEILKL
jgi:hypothetical protein